VLSNIELKENTIIVVLGASGDLAKKKTVRAQWPLKRAPLIYLFQFPALFGLVSEQKEYDIWNCAADSNPVSESILA
jgi:glucose-6-phosphate 1-dehydrogenase